MTTLTANYQSTPATAQAGKFRAWLAAVLAGMSASLMAQADRAQQRTRLQDADQLARMASRFDASQPNLAAELRYLASRG